MSVQTPMKQQYNALKSQHSDCLLFFRLGDFYEMFDDDARTASRELDLALTTRDRNKSAEEQTPMCGVPYHSAEAYIGRLISKGYKVAICEQLDDPAETRGLLTRDVVRIISPGTVTEGSMLQEGRSNYLASLWLEGDAGAVCFADISTGEMYVSCYERDAVNHLSNELARFHPREAVISPGAEENEVLHTLLYEQLRISVETGGERFDEDAAVRRLLLQFHVSELSALDLEGEDSGVRAAGALLAYIEETQKIDLGNIAGLDLVRSGKYMELDYATLRSLELCQNLRTDEKKGSLLWVLDETRTPMGARMLRSWVERPLLNPAAIRHRLGAVKELVDNAVLRGELTAALRRFGDLRRLVCRCVYATANAKDLRALGEYCAAIPGVKLVLSSARSGYLTEIAALDPLEDITNLVSLSIADEPPISVRDGDLLRSGYNGEVDRLRQLKKNGKKMLVELADRERERTGIKKMKVGYNKVFGYYLDVPNSAGEVTLPPEYIRRQTLVNAERYVTPELKKLEEDLVGAADRLNALEYSIFCEIRAKAALEVHRVQATSDALAQLDCLCALAETAVRRGYCMPEVDMGRTLHIVGGRHPVVEAAQPDTPFVPNDTLLNDRGDLVAVVTGPNMAGKSTYMRQTALIVLMAQIGSFVPARSATVGVIDRVFTRIGASDDLSSGQSTFMVEMNEMANILKYATDRSLLILDEIGRGTSTYDGMAIARAVLEHCADKKRLGAKTMFATHYHELAALEGVLPGVVNYNITAKKQGGSLIFLRKIVRGCADDSYGIEVAKLAGIPNSVIERAKSCLKELEQGAGAPETGRAAPAEDQMTLADVGADEVRDILQRLDLDTITPLEALNLLWKLKKKVVS